MTGAQHAHRCCHPELAKRSEGSVDSLQVTDPSASPRLRMTGAEHAHRQLSSCRIPQQRIRGEHA